MQSRPGLEGRSGLLPDGFEFLEVGMETVSGMSPAEKEALGERLEAVRDRLVRAARVSGRSPDAVRLIAVSKLHPVEAIVAAMGFGQRLFGENYVQEALAKQKALPDPSIEWHCIGHVQLNKAKDVSGRFSLIHTVDSLKFAEVLARRLPETVRRQSILLQVNIGNEPQKSGVNERDLPALAEAILAIPRLRICGLMCLPPFFDDGEVARPYFARLRELRDSLQTRLDIPLPELSMGMSGDCEQAVEEGATLVRVGTDIFGPRPARQA